MIKKLFIAFGFSLFLFQDLFATGIVFVDEIYLQQKRLYDRISEGEMHQWPHTKAPFAPIEKNGEAAFAIYKFEADNPQLIGRLVLKSLIVPSDKRAEVFLALNYQLSGWTLDECLKNVTETLQVQGPNLTKKYFDYSASVFQTTEIDYGTAASPVLLMRAGWSVFIADILHQKDFRIINYLLPAESIAPSSWKSMFYNSTVSLKKEDILRIVRSRNLKSRSKL